MHITQCVRKIITRVKNWGLYNMAFKPTVSKVHFPLPPQVDGLNTKMTDSATPPTQSPDLQNIMFDDFGAIRSADGYAKFNSTQIASAPIDGLGTYIDPSNDRILIAACNTNLYSQDGTSFTVIGSNVYTAGVDVRILPVSGKLIFTNGYMRPLMWDGTNLLRYGIYGPDPVTATVTSYASGVLSGTYNYALTYVNTALVESSYTVIATGMVAQSATINIANIITAPASYGVSYMNLYRNTAAVTGTYWLVTALTATQTYVQDNNADVYLITEAPVTDGPPPKCAYMVYYRGRVWAAGDPDHPYRLYYSAGGAPERWPILNYLDVEEGDGFYISGIREWGNAIVIHKNDGKGNGVLYLLYIADSQGVSDADNWYLFKSPSSFSAISNKSQAFFQNLLFFINRSGAHALSGQDLARSVADSDTGRFQSETLSYDIDTDVKGWTAAALKGCASITFDNKVWVAVPTAQSSTNNKIYVYDFVRLGTEKLGIWTKLSAPAVKNWVVNDGVLYAGGYDGYIYTMSTGTAFDGATIAPYYETAWICGTPEQEFNTKVWRFLTVTHTTPGNWNIVVQYWLDFRTGVEDGSFNLNLNSGGSLWGVMKWSNSKWGGGYTTMDTKTPLVNAVGSAIKFRFSSVNVNESWKIKDISLDYNVRGLR
jgi:hypothetical protein